MIEDLVAVVLPYLEPIEITMILYCFPHCVRPPQRLDIINKMWPLVTTTLIVNGNDISTSIAATITTSLPLLEPPLTNENEGSTRDMRTACHSAYDVYKITIYKAILLPPLLGSQCFATVPLGEFLQMATFLLKEMSSKATLAHIALLQWVILLLNARRDSMFLWKPFVLACSGVRNSKYITRQQLDNIINSVWSTLAVFSVCFLRDGKRGKREREKIVTKKKSFGARILARFGHINVHIFLYFGPHMRVVDWMMCVDAWVWILLLFDASFVMMTQNCVTTHHLTAPTLCGNRRWYGPPVRHIAANLIFIIR